ncbi:hypothetical protein [Bradyrhizobium australiense]|uniref:Uncharacterized protein n=1 Tax=Bradyrhizobium australiense TaxID=2721161 RepID=A0A7Y4GX70_9BRAD|nr:hypothetical protein [Bradyrhizobium australiense]NOJ43373.1 hypothetical protein [Bradyrhizobium australiense]
MLPVPALPCAKAIAGEMRAAIKTAAMSDRVAMAFSLSNNASQLGKTRHVPLTLIGRATRADALTQKRVNPSSLADSLDWNCRDATPHQGSHTADEIAHSLDASPVTVMLPVPFVIAPLTLPPKVMLRPKSAAAFVHVGVAGVSRLP